MPKAPNRTYFVMPGKKLKEVAEKGNPQAQEEMERRAKRRVKKKKKKNRLSEFLWVLLQGS